MKSLATFVAIAITLLVSPLSRAALFTDKAIDEYAAKKLEPIINKCDEHTKSIDELSETVRLHTETINKLIKQLEAVQKQLDINAEKIDSIPVASPTAFWIKVLLWGIGVLIIAVMGFIFWPRKPISSAYADPYKRPRCPRCGWEHDPTDTICKNPNCKTQF